LSTRPSFGHCESCLMADHAVKQHAVIRRWSLDKSGILTSGSDEKTGVSITSDIDV
jgi:hypothetical protein